jgi:hypothetical protein
VFWNEGFARGTFIVNVRRLGIELDVPDPIVEAVVHDDICKPVFLRELKHEQGKGR